MFTKGFVGLVVGVEMAKKLLTLLSYDYNIELMVVVLLNGI